MWSGNLLHRCQSLEGRRVSRPSGQKKNMTYIYLKRWHIRRKEWEGWAWRKAAEREELHGRKTMCLSLQGCRITWRWDGDPGKQQYCSSPRISGRATPLQQFLFFYFFACRPKGRRERRDEGGVFIRSIIVTLYYLSATTIKLQQEEENFFGRRSENPETCTDGLLRATLFNNNCWWTW